MPNPNQPIELVGSGFPALHCIALELLDELAQTGRLIDGQTLAMSAVARGITYALAAPEWSAAALREAGAPAAIITHRIASARAFIAGYPIELTQE